jgi:hypothetical protein
MCQRTHTNTHTRVCLCTFINTHTYKYTWKDKHFKGTVSLQGDACMITHSLPRTSKHINTYHARTHTTHAHFTWCSLTSRRRMHDHALPLPRTAKQIHTYMHTHRHINTPCGSVSLEGDYTLSTTDYKRIHTCTHTHTSPRRTEATHASYAHFLSLPHNKKRTEIYKYIYIDI